MKRNVLLTGALIAAAAAFGGCDLLDDLKDAAADAAGLEKKSAGHCELETPDIGGSAFAYCLQLKDKVDDTDVVNTTALETNCSVAGDVLDGDCPSENVLSKCEYEITGTGPYVAVFSFQEGDAEDAKNAIKDAADSFCGLVGGNIVE